ncbi:MAG TPA: hypothetical protein VGQ24_08495, partial [Gemmatimonadales bacterium]|nr:hypothetical protein [Gemmatimonadales bacterium]
DNARGVLKRAGEMVRTLVAIGAGREGARADRRTGRQADGRRDQQAYVETVESSTAVEAVEREAERTTRPPVRPSA